MVSGLQPAHDVASQIGLRSGLELGIPQATTEPDSRFDIVTPLQVSNKVVTAAVLRNGAKVAAYRYPQVYCSLSHRWIRLLHLAHVPCRRRTRGGGYGCMGRPCEGRKVQYCKIREKRYLSGHLRLDQVNTLHRRATVLTVQ